MLISCPLLAILIGQKTAKRSWNDRIRHLYIYVHDSLFFFLFPFFFFFNY